jgi:hypothetical protein
MSTRNKFCIESPVTRKSEVVRMEVVKKRAVRRRIMRRRWRACAPFIQQEVRTRGLRPRSRTDNAEQHRCARQSNERHR